MYLVLARLGKGDGTLEFGTLLDRLGMIAVILLAFSFFFGVATYFLLTRSARCENRDKPGMLFFAGCALQFGLLGFLIFLLWCGHPCIVAFIAYGLLIAALNTGLPPHRWDDYRQFRQANPLPKMQFYTMDLSISVLYYGFLLAVYLLAQDFLLYSVAASASCCDADSMPTLWQQWISGCWLDLVPSHILTLELAFSIVVSISMIAALDVLRRIKRPLGVTTRSLALLGILLYFTCTFVTGGLVAWFAWRMALNTVGLEEWRKLKRSQCLPAATTPS